MRDCSNEQINNIKHILAEVQPNCELQGAQIYENGEGAASGFEDTDICITIKSINLSSERKSAIEMQIATALFPYSCSLKEV